MEETEFIKQIDEIIKKPYAECSPEEAKLLGIERVRCKNTFIYWLSRYGKLSQAPTLDSPGGMIPFKLWPHTVEIIKSLLTENLISILKSRQIGASWLVAAYCLWCAEFHESDKTLLFSKGELEAGELLNKCKVVYSGQPEFLHISMDAKSTTKISFTVMKSSIEALAATENAGIGYQVSRIVCDEHIEHPYASKNYMSAKPAIDAGGGQFISIFTSNEDKLNTLAVELFLAGREGKNGFKSLFFPYTVRPGRDDKWYEKTRNSIPESELQGITPDMYMARNYPRSVEEALSPSKTIAVFDKTVLDSMMGETRNPLKVTRDGIDSNIVNIYIEPHIGGMYISASDTSHGVGKDNNVTLVLDVKTGAVVADIYQSNISPEELAMHSVRLLDLYNRPLWYPEDNDWGRVTITTAQTLGYKNFGYRDAKREKLGWHTDEKTRTDLWGALIPAINNHQIIIYNKEALKTFYDVIRQTAKNGRIEAMSGRHDDYPMCLGIAWTNKDKVNVNVSYEPIKSLHFN